MQDKILYNLISFLAGFAGGIITAFGKGWVDEVFKKREEKRKQIETFIGKVTDLVAVVTSNGYKVRQNEADRRRMQRAAFQLERLGKVELARNIREYLNKWSIIYGVNQIGTHSREELKQMSERTKDLDTLTDKILKS